ncbi:MAG: hypothetical protein JO015_03530 [Verrucomicrobia bacterium]|nr:hypothetical protein [Verrucomicrobiota bacterium]
MNMEPWLLNVRRELTRIVGLLEAKIERHADLLLWTFSPIVALGLALDHSPLSGRYLQPLAQVILLVLIALLLPLPWLFVPSRLGAFTGSRSRNRRKGVRVNWRALISVLQCGLMCVSNGFLALFVLCVVHRNLQGGFECLVMAALPIVALWETVYLEERVVRPVMANAGLVAWIARLKFDVVATLGSCGLACVLFYAFLRMSILPG